MVERPAPGAAHLIEHPVEDAAALFVFVEPFVHKVTQETAALRHAPAKRELHAARGVLIGGVVLEEAHEVARAREAEADDFRIGGAIDDVVDASGLEAAVERDGLIVDEAPPRSRD